MSALRIAALALAGLITLQLAWHLVLAPPASLPLAFVLAISVLPLAIAALAWSLGQARTPFWTSVLALAYFTHGVMEAWTVAAIRPLALTEVALALGLILAVGADGLARRRAAKRAVQGL